jgi:hypothetical protein
MALDVTDLVEAQQNLEKQKAELLTRMDVRKEKQHISFSIYSPFLQRKGLSPLSSLILFSFVLSNFFFP